MHMQLVFYLGVKGLFGVPLPIWVELQGLGETQNQDHFNLLLTYFSGNGKATPTSHAGAPLSESTYFYAYGPSQS